MKVIKIEGERQAGKSWTLEAVAAKAQDEGKLVVTVPYYAATGSRSEAAAALVGAAHRKILFSLEQWRVRGVPDAVVLIVDDLPTDSVEEVEKECRRQLSNLDYLFIGVAP